MANRFKSPKPPTPKQEAASENTSQVRLEELARTSTELARIVAKNYSAAPELLQELGSSSDDTTRKGVASNPNTSTDVLLKLGAQFPGQLLENPVFPLLLLENPNLLADMPLATLRSLLKRDAVPESFLEWAADSTDEGVLLAVAMNSNTPKTALSKLIQNQNADVAEAAKLHVNWAGEMSQGWEEAASSAMQITRLPRDRQTETYLWAIGAIPEFLVPALDREVRLSIAQNPNTPAHILEMLAGDSDRHSKIRVALAQNPNITTVLLKQLVGDQYYPIHEAVAYHPKISLSILQQFHCQQKATKTPETPPERLRELAKSQWAEIRKATASHANTPNDVLEYLAEDLDASVRASVAANPHTLDRVQLQLAEDRKLKVRAVVYQNLNVPSSIRRQISLEADADDKYDDDVEITVDLFGVDDENDLDLLDEDLNEYDDVEIPRRNTSEAVLQERAGDENSIVRRAIAKNPNTYASALEQLADDKDWNVRLAVAQNPNTPRGVLEKLAGDPNQFVHLAIAKNRNTPASALEQLAINCDNNIRTAIAENPNTPTKTLAQLSEDEHLVTLRAVAANPNTSPSVLYKLASNSDSGVQGEVLNMLKRIPKNSDVLSKILQKLAETNHDHVRNQVAIHCSTPVSVLEQLANGKEREYVAWNPSTPINILLQMARDKDSSIRQAAINNLCKNVAHKSETPGDILQKLTIIKDWRLGLSLARHPNTPENVLEQLAKHQDWKVRTVVAKNPNTAVSVLKNLLQDKNKNVREAALANINMPESILEQFAIAKNPQTPQETIAQLTTSEWLIIRECVALHPNASKTVLEQLAKDKSSAVRSSVAQNFHTPGNLLEQLAQEKDQEVAIAVAQNPNTPISILEQFAQQGKQNNQIKQAALKNLFSQYPDRVVPFLSEYIKSFQPSFTRLLVFLHPLAPSSFLAKNFRSSSWLERYAIAQNPNTPAAIRQRLAQDGNRIVRAAATNLQHYVSD